MIGTYGYIAPELFMVSKSIPGSDAGDYQVELAPTDAFSLGALLLCLLRGRPLLTPAEDHSQTRAQISNPHFPASAVYSLLLERDTSWLETLATDAPACTQSVRELITRLLDPDPSCRISLDDVLRHPWVARSQGLSDFGLDVDVPSLLQARLVQCATSAGVLAILDQLIDDLLLWRPKTRRPRPTIKK